MINGPRSVVRGLWSVVCGLWSQETGLWNMCHALKTRYTRYTVDGQRFKVLHFRYTGCYTPLHFGPVDGVT